jgi:hypothetical protein
VNSTITIAPQITSWFRPRASTTSTFILSRNLTTRNPVRVDGDTAGAFILPQTLNNSRFSELGATVEPAVLIRRLLGDSSSVAQYFSRFRVLDISRRLTLQSTYDLATFDPGTSYQFALGGLSDFLRQGESFALGAGEVRVTNASGGFDLPLGLSATASYAVTESDRYQRIGVDRFLLVESSQRDWPNATVRWSRALRNGPLRLITFSGNLRERETSSIIPSGTPNDPPAINRSQTQQLAPDLQLIFANGLTVLGSMGRDRGTAQNNGNLIRRDGDSWTARAEWQVRLPRRLSALRRPLRASFVAQEVDQRDCIELPDSGTCELISAVVRREFGGSLDADFAGVANGGFTVQWVTNDLKHLDRKSSAVTLTLTIQVPLSFGGY